MSPTRVSSSRCCVALRAAIPAQSRPLGVLKGYCARSRKQTPRVSSITVWDGPVTYGLCSVLSRLGVLTRLSRELLERFSCNVGRQPISDGPLAERHGVSSIRFRAHGDDTAIRQSECTPSCSKRLLQLRLRHLLQRIQTSTLARPQAYLGPSRWAQRIRNGFRGPFAYAGAH